MKFGLCSCGEVLIYERQITEESNVTDNGMISTHLYRCPKCGKPYHYKITVDIKEVE